MLSEDKVVLPREGLGPKGNTGRAMPSDQKKKRRQAGTRGALLALGARQPKSRTPPSHFHKCAITQVKPSSPGGGHLTTRATHMPKHQWPWQAELRGAAVGASTPVVMIVYGVADSPYTGQPAATQIAAESVCEQPGGGDPQGVPLAVPREPRRLLAPRRRVPDRGIGCFEMSVPAF
jgi:hypothetical protein